MSCRANDWMAGTALINATKIQTLLFSVICWIRLFESSQAPRRRRALWFYALKGRRGCEIRLPISSFKNSFFFRIHCKSTHDNLNHFLSLLCSHSIWFVSLEFHIPVFNFFLSLCFFTSSTVSFSRSQQLCDWWENWPWILRRTSNIPWLALASKDGRTARGIWHQRQLRSSIGADRLLRRFPSLYVFGRRILQLYCFLVRFCFFRLNHL